MGHERLGYLPRTRKWSNLVSMMGSGCSADSQVREIADTTLRNVENRYRGLAADECVVSIFYFLVEFARSCRNIDSNVEEYLPSSKSELAVAEVLRNLRRKIQYESPSSEHGEIAYQAASDALCEWHGEHDSIRLPLFGTTTDSIAAWRSLGSGAGFCELSRIFFARLTERYLHYFLDRAASSVCSGIQERIRFRNGIRDHIDLVSRHAFETSRITQSFAAGWYNKRIGHTTLDSEEIKAFLSHAFGKLRDELIHERTSQ